MKLRSIILSLFFCTLGVFPAWSLDLASDFWHLQIRQYFMRVALAQNIDAARLIPHSDFLVHDRDGKILYHGKADTPLRVVATEQKPIQVVWYLRVGMFEYPDRASADALAASARDKSGLPVVVLPDPTQEHAPLPSGEMPPMPVWTVLAGPFASEDAAEAQREKAERIAPARLLKAPIGLSETRIEIQTETGAVLVAGTGYLGVRLKDSAGLIRADAIKTTDTAWANKQAWIKTNAYRGLMEVRGNERGHLLLVNRVFLEDYLYGVLPAEIGAGAPFEMLKTQAVISRSVVIAMIRNNYASNWFFDVSNTQTSQVYQGALCELPETNAAVDATWGQVCVYENHVIDAVYSHCCGGIIASMEDAWPSASPKAYLTRHVDSLSGRKVPNFAEDPDEVETWTHEKSGVLCNPGSNADQESKDAFRWSRGYTAEQLTKVVKETYPQVEEVTNIRVTKRTPSGLAAEVTLDVNPGKPIVLSHDSEIRRGLGDIPSSFFSLSCDREKKSKRLIRVDIRGAGRGHAVGLCQMGASALAKQGKDYLFILKHYYQGVSVYKIYK